MLPAVPIAPNELSTRSSAGRVSPATRPPFGSDEIVFARDLLDFGNGFFGPLNRRL